MLGQARSLPPADGELLLSEGPNPLLPPNELLTDWGVENRRFLTREWRATFIVEKARKVTPVEW